jgi:hypothetical protein
MTGSSKYINDKKNTMNESKLNSSVLINNRTS